MLSNKNVIITGNPNIDMNKPLWSAGMLNLNITGFEWMNMSDQPNARSGDISRAGFAERLKKARTNKGYSQPQLAMACGWGSAQVRISQYEQRKREPSWEDVTTLARALDVEPYWLLTGDDVEHPNPPPSGRRKVQLFEMVMANGRFVPRNTGTVETSLEDFTDDAMAFRISNDSMAPLFPIGSIVFVEPHVTPTPESFVLADLGNETLEFRQLFPHPDKIELRPINPKYESIYLSEKGKIIGVCLEMQIRKVFKEISNREF